MGKARPDFIQPTSFYARAVFAVLVLLIAAAAGCGKDPASTAQEKCDCPECGGPACDILMIGNSLTAFHNTPGMIQDLADESGVDMKVRSALYLGYTLKMIVESTDVFERIRDEQWDFVVIQGSSYNIAFPDSHYLILPPIEMLSDSIRANAPCTKIVFFMDWCMRDGIDIDGEHLDFHEFTMMIRGGTLVMADRMGFIVAPIGVAWDVLLASYTGIDLHDLDGGHPSLEGSYLNACVYYSTFLKRASTGIEVYWGIPLEHADIMQRIASRTVLDSLDTWNND